MKKKFMLPLICFGLGLTACGGKVNNTPQEVQNSFDKFCMTYKEMVKNDSNFAKDLLQYKDCEFTGYTIKKQTENVGTLNLHGKIFDDKNTYNSFLKLSYDNINIDSIFTQNSDNIEKNKMDWFDNLSKLITTANYSDYEENIVKSFDEFNNAAKVHIPQIAKEVKGSLESVEVKALDKGKYDSKYEQYRFNFITENLYKYKNEKKNATITKFNITLRMTNEEYNEINENPSFYVDKFIYGSTVNKENLFLNKKVVDAIDTTIYGADMGIEL